MAPGHLGVSLTDVNTWDGGELDVVVARPEEESHQQDWEQRELADRRPEHDVARKRRAAGLREILQPTHQREVEASMEKGRPADGAEPDGACAAVWRAGDPAEEAVLPQPRADDEPATHVQWNAYRRPHHGTYHQRQRARPILRAQAVRTVEVLYVLDRCKASGRSRSV